jgi:hypothetical protein
MLGDTFELSPDGQKNEKKKIIIFRRNILSTKICRQNVLLTRCFSTEVCQQNISTEDIGFDVDSTAIITRHLKGIYFLSSFFSDQIKEI